MLAEISDLHYRFKGEDTEALAGVSLDVRPGEILGLIGPDGAGKTTLMRVMAGVLKAASGNISILGGNPIADHAALSRRVGYMTQRFSLYEDLSIEQNLTLYAALHGISQSDAATQGAELLEAAGLSRFRPRPAGKLSGGMKQKLALICAMFGSPELMLLDEPGVGVDPLSRRDLWKLVERARGAGRGIVWATAYLDEAAKCDRVCILHEGRVHYLGPPDGILADLRGRVFSLHAGARNRLSVLRQMQARDDVMDAMIEGANVRFMLRAGASADDLPEGAAPVEPNFEEAFINLLGGSVQKAEHREPDPPLPIHDATSDGVIVTDGLTKRFGDFVATDHLTINVKRGEIFGLLGANGAGKTTAFRMMCGLITPSDGKAEILGIDLRRDPRKAREHIGYMAQKFSLYSDNSVLQNLQFFATVYNLKGRYKEERIARAIDRYTLSPYLRRNAGALPLGVKQRLSMACATLHDPEFLFLDEPTSGVDPFARRAFWEEINEMSARGVTIIVTTHFMDEAQYLHRMVIMNSGKVIAHGSPEELKAAVATPELPEPSMEDAFIHYIRIGKGDAS